MTINTGDRLPEATLMKATSEGPKPVNVSEIFNGKTVALFAVPGAFTPTCSARHPAGRSQSRHERRNDPGLGSGVRPGSRAGSGLKLAQQVFGRRHLELTALLDVELLDHAVLDQHGIAL